MKETAAGINGILDVAISPIDTLEALTSPNAGSTIVSGLTEDIKNDWNDGTVQGKGEAAGRFLTIVVPMVKALKAAKAGKVAGVAGKVGEEAAEEGIKATQKTAGRAMGEVAQQTGEEIAQRGAREGAEEAAQRGAREGTEEAAQRGAREGAEESAQRGAREGAEEAAQRGARETAEEAAQRGGGETANIPHKVVREASGKTGDGVRISSAVQETNINKVKTIETSSIKNIKQVLMEGRKRVYTNLSGNKIYWVDQNPKDMEAIITSRLASDANGNLLEGQVAQAVQETGLLRGVGLKMERADKSLAGDIDVLTDKYIIEVKESFGAFKKKQFLRFTDPTHPDYFNFDDKGIIYYIGDKNVKSFHEQKALNLLESTENIIVVYDLEELKGVLLQ